MLSRTFGMLRVIALASALVVLAGLPACSPGDNGRDATVPGGESSVSQQMVSGTPADWLNALCAPGKFYENAQSQSAMPGAVGGASCIPRITTSNLNTSLVWISQFDSEFKMRNALPARLAKFAAIARYNGLLWVFSIIDRDPSPLGPLEQYGFSIEDVSSAASDQATRTNSPSILPQPAAPSSSTGQQGTALSPNANSYVAIQTASGRTRCQVSRERVICENSERNWPANGVEILPDGSTRFADGNLGNSRPVTLRYQTYVALGWTIVASTSGTQFTNDQSGHGAYVTAESVQPF